MLALQEHDTVQVVGHHNVFVERKFLSKLTRSLPFCANDLAERIRHHGFACHVTQQARSIVNADRDEVGTAL